MEKILLKKNFSSWLKSLNSHQIYAPVKEDNIWSFELLEDPDAVTLEYPNTEIPPKKVLFPQREVLFEFESTGSKEIKIHEPPQDNTPIVIFGVRSCDAKGISKITRIFTGEYEDNLLLGRIDRTTIVGLTCVDPPSPNCFCTSVDGSPHAKEGLDMLMTDMGDNYYLEAITNKGEDLLKNSNGLFADPEEHVTQEKNRIHLESEKKLRYYLKDVGDIKSRLPSLFETDFWDEESQSCIRCGICTFTCPVCHCFDINDEVTTTYPLKGKRVRTWDNCQFPDFTMHSSGHNPRSDRASRLRQRVMHKFNYFNENCPEYLCTGCGRCITKCPVGIDIFEVLEKLSEYEK